LKGTSWTAPEPSSATSAARSRVWRRDRPRMIQSSARCTGSPSSRIHPWRSLSRASSGRRH